MKTSLPDRADDLDRLLSGFLKAQMPRPWPAAPATPAAGARSEPSVLAAARAPHADAPRNVPAAARDSGNRARYTLAASVALLLGTCWTLSNGFQPVGRSAGVPAPQSGGDFDLSHGRADGKNELPGLIHKAAEQPGKKETANDPLDLGKMK